MKFKESKSIYLQIADRICDEILQGQYKEEERIPSVREYAATVEVNANTVVRSFDYLQGQDIIYNKRGLGYFVALEGRERTDYRIGIDLHRSGIFPDGRDTFLFLILSLQNLVTNSVGYLQVY